jgi:MraZ protein
MFTGEYRHTIDDKNRLAIPAPIRDSIDINVDGKGFYITRGLDTCLFMYTTNMWEKVLSKKMEKLSFTGKMARNFQRTFFSNASKITDCDQQGRILLPQKLKEIAKINKNVVIVGVNKRIEIWDEKMWNDVETENEKEFEKVAEELFQSGFFSSETD